MKKVLAILLSGTLLFSACGDDENGASTGDSEEPRFFSYITADFTIDVPDGWETVNAFTGEYPEEVRVVFRNNIKESSFIANVSVIREDNELNLSNVDFAQIKLNEHAATLVDYTLLSQEEISLGIGSDESSTFLATFQGKNEVNGPTLEFMQTYLVHGDDTWTITATYLPSEDSFVIERMNTMIQSFTLR